MPSPTIIELLDFETQIEAAVASILTAGLASISPSLGPVQILVSRDEDTKAVPRLEIMFGAGAELSQWGAFGQADPKQVPVAYEGLLSILVATGRIQEEAAMAEVHGPLRGVVRYFMSAGAKAFTSTNLPWLQILQMKHAGLRPQLQEAKAQDYDVIQYALKFAIKNEVWPSGA